MIGVYILWLALIAIISVIGSIFFLAMISDLRTEIKSLKTQATKTGEMVQKHERELSRLETKARDDMTWKMRIGYRVKQLTTQVGPS